MVTPVVGATGCACVPLAGRSVEAGGLAAVRARPPKTPMKTANAAKANPQAAAQKTPGAGPGARPGADCQTHNQYRAPSGGRRDRYGQRAPPGIHDVADLFAAHGARRSARASGAATGGEGGLSVGDEHGGPDRRLKSGDIEWRREHQEPGVVAAGHADRRHGLQRQPAAGYDVPKRPRTPVHASTSSRPEREDPCRRGRREAVSPKARPPRASERAPTNPRCRTDR